MSVSPLAPDPVARPVVHTRLQLLDGFGLTTFGRPTDVPPGGQRLLAFLALHRGTRDRSQVAGELWPDVLDDQAAAALRSTLWRLRRVNRDLLHVTVSQVSLASHVEVDAVRLIDLARRLVRTVSELSASDLEEATLRGALLPGWHDDWVLVEREQIAQLQLHGLEALAERLLAAGRHGAAMEAALDAVRLDPLRESAHRIIVRIHLAEGNVSEALRRYDAVARQLGDELGVDPSPLLTELVRPYLTLPPRPGSPRDPSSTRRARGGDVRGGGCRG